jgi:hypothetical protein
MARLLGVLVAILLVSAVSAAPVPKAAKRKVPDVAGTTWVSDENEAKLGVIEYTFLDNGTLSWRTQGSNNVNTKGSWKQDGDKLWWEVNDKYVDYNVTFKDGRFDGSALNVVNLRWTISLKPKGEGK